MPPTPLPATSLVSKSVPRRQPAGTAHHRARHAPPHQPKAMPGSRLDDFLFLANQESLRGTAEPGAWTSPRRFPGTRPRPAGRCRAPRRCLRSARSSAPGSAAARCRCRSLGASSAAFRARAAVAGTRRTSVEMSGCSLLSEVSWEMARMEPPRALLDLELWVTGKPCVTSSIHCTRPIEGAGHWPNSAQKHQEKVDRRSSIRAGQTDQNVVKSIG